MKKPPKPLESAVQKSILEFLAYHHAVAWSCRMNSGAVKLENRFVRFNTMPGMSDLIGQMRDGRFLAIEVKREGWKKPKDDHERAQESFLKLVRENGGVAFFATSIDDVKIHLDTATRAGHD